MNLFLCQLILAARRTDGEDGVWMQLVVFLILGVFWAVSGILKARGEKERQKKKQQTETFRSIRIPIKTPQKSLAERYQIQRKPAPQQVKPAVRPIVRQAGAGSKPIVRERPVSKPVVAVVKSKPTIAASEIDRKVEHAPKYVAQEVESTAKKTKETVKTTALAIPVKPLVPLSSHEELQAAILHYEILGQCVAFRESDEQVWMR